MYHKRHLITYQSYRNKYHSTKETYEKSLTQVHEMID
jgi:hypothetical protein